VYILILNKIKEITQHPGVRKYFKNSSWLLAEKVFRLIIGLFVGVWVAKYLGPESYGLFSYAQSIVVIITIVASLGVDGILVRELINHKDKRDELLGTAFTLRLIGAIIVILITIIAISLLPHERDTNIIIIVITGAVFFQCFNVIDFYFQSEVLSKYIVRANMISLLISSIAKVILILYNAPLLAFATMMVVDSVIFGIGYIYIYYKQNLSLFIWKFNYAMAKRLLKDSWPLIFSSFVLMIQARIDQVMIKNMLGNSEVGYYSVALKLIESVAFVTIILKTSLSPSVIKAKSISTELYENRLQNLYRINMIAFLIVALPIYFLADHIISILYGEKYANTGILLSIMASRLYFANLGTARAVYLMVENLFKYALFTMILGTIVNIILNYYWIAEYGTKGAVYASIISFFVTIFVVDLFYTKTRRNLWLMIKSTFTFYRLNVKL